MLRECNNILPKLKYILELENNKINFIRIIFTKNHNCVQTSIYREPTATDFAISKDSRHLFKYKLTGIGHFLNRLDNYPMQGDEKKRL
jgi:hypothetical protein